ncbi:uncharacterized protein LOC124142101 [Haliotis rufescens]|uniref:Vitelline envelope zona pellucida domain protein 26 n=1 Tax=Haliotis rufescens TaxID=6454 RepID=D0EL64_HALRU|nr:uncharacterized protein LOC124142101 [Haliotis rufescens]ACX37436.1 vitelline envelope zona pellucida domain protein 26 [Haliotis rufescens]
MALLAVALLVLVQVYLSSAITLNVKAAHLTCSGKVPVPSNLVIADKLHPLHGALVLSPICTGGKDRFRGMYPLPFHMSVWYTGSPSSRCVLKSTSSGYYIQVDVLAYGKYSVGKLLLRCPKPLRPTPRLTAPLPAYPVTPISDVKDYVWVRCGVASNDVEFIPQSVKIVAAIDCKGVRFTYVIKPNTPLEVQIFLAGKLNEKCVYNPPVARRRRGAAPPPPPPVRSVAIHFFKHRNFEYLGTGRVDYCPPITDDYILKVKPHCGSSVGAPAYVTGVTDVDADFRAICKNGRKYVFVNTNKDKVNYKLKVKYSGNANTQCVFNRRQNSNVYVITVQISWGRRGVVVHKHNREYQLSCAFGAKGSDESPTQRIEGNILAPRIVESFVGSGARSYVKLHLIDVLGRQVYALPIGRMVQLRAWSNGQGSEVGVRSVGCDAIGARTNTRFAIIRAGCGDGVVFAKNEGFSTKGLNSTSPYFKAFSLHNDAKIRFECNFTMCTSNCDGNSCAIAGRRRRDADVHFSDFIMTESDPITLL